MHLSLSSRRSQSHSRIVTRRKAGALPSAAGQSTSLLPLPHLSPSPLIRLPSAAHTAAVHRRLVLSTSPSPSPRLRLSHRPTQYAALPSHPGHQGHQGQQRRLPVNTRGAPTGTPTSLSLSLSLNLSPSLSPRSPRTKLISRRCWPSLQKSSRAIWNSWSRSTKSS